MNKQIHSLMQKEMTRKEFLATVGFGVASIFGFASVLKMLTGRQEEGDKGYGNSAYGG
jgi:hypothetical protein